MGTKPDFFYDANCSESDFLHDLSTPLAVAFGHLNLLAAKLEDAQEGLDHAMLLAKLQKAMASFDKVNYLLDQRRRFLNHSE